MRFFLVFILVSQLIYSYYTDKELEAVWDSLSDIYNPSLEDYRLVETYLKSGERPYLKNYFDTGLEHGFSLSTINLRIAQLRNFKLVGSNGEMPIFELHKMNVSEETKDRCVLVYASYNGIYPKSAQCIVEELKEHGYSGHVMVRIGGFPNLSEGGLKFAPFFCWKQEFFKEALRMGFRKIIHLDSCMHPLCDLDDIFKIMEEKGYFLMYTTQGCLQYLPRYKNTDYLNISPEQAKRIPWLPGYVLGINFDNKRVVKLFREWETSVKNIHQFFCLGWDETAMSILAWKYRFPPIDKFENRVTYHQPSSNSLYFFYFDTTRVRD